MRKFVPKFLTTEAELAAIDEAWESCRTSLERPSLEHRRGWLAGEARSHQGLMVVTLTEGGQTRAIAPFLLRHWKLDCRLGYRSVLAFPMTLARLCGDTFLAPSDSATHEELLEAIARAPVPYRTLFIEGLAIDSPLRKLIETSPTIRRHFLLYCPTPPTKHWLIRLPKTFAEYDSALGKKRRGQFKASERKLALAAGSPVTLERVTTPEGLPAYFEAVERISRTSWQGQTLGQVIEATSSGARRIEEFARAGWFRGYLLRSATEPIAFVLGFQSDGTYIYDRIGYDPKWAAYSPGNVTLYRLVEDVCKHNHADVIDLGVGDNQYKRVFGNESFDDQNVYLMRRSVYTNVARATHQTFVAVTSAGRDGLKRVKLLDRARRVLRRGGSMPKDDSSVPKTASDDAETA
jgi:hypothetical protein